MDNITDANDERPPTLELAFFQDIYASLGHHAAQNLAILMTSFFNDTSRLLVEAQRALAAADRETLHRLAHTLKGTAAIMGAQALSALARELEGMTKAGIPAAAADWLARAEVEYVQVQAALASAQQELCATGETDANGVSLERPGLS